MPILDEIKARLVAQAVLPDASILKTGRAVIPPGDGPYISLVETGGTGAARTQNDTATERPSVSITSRAKTAQAARAALKAAYDALGGANGLTNVTLSGTFYLSITATQNITDIGEDAAGRLMYVFNIGTEKQPS
jgi:hypothetical protein